VTPIAYFTVNATMTLDKVLSTRLAFPFRFTVYAKVRVYNGVSFDMTTSSAFIIAVLTVFTVFTVALAHCLSSLPILMFQFSFLV
jgi:hypothetical protein